MKISSVKIKLYAAVVLIICTANLYAQRGEIGLRFMPTFTATDIQTSAGGTVKGEATFGYGVGGILGFSFTDNVGIQTEVMYSSISQKYKEEDVERKINLKYVNIPLLLSLNTGKTKFVNFNLVGGPQMGISVGSSISGVATDSMNAVLSVKKGDIGIAFGAGLDFGVNQERTLRFSLGFRGVRGLFDISDDSNTLATDSYYVLDRTHTKTNSVYFGLSYLF